MAIVLHTYYYAIRGRVAKGHPTRVRLEELGITWMAEYPRPSSSGATHQKGSWNGKHTPVVC